MHWWNRNANHFPVAGALLWHGHLKTNVKVMKYRNISHCNWKVCPETYLILNVRFTVWREKKTLLALSSRCLLFLHGYELQSYKNKEYAPGNVVNGEVAKCVRLRNVIVTTIVIMTDSRKICHGNNCGDNNLIHVHLHLNWK